MRPAYLGTGTDRFRRPGERWRPRQVSVGRRPVLLLTGIRYETARGPSHGSGRPRGGRRWHVVNEGRPTSDDGLSQPTSVSGRNTQSGGWVDPEGDYCFAC